jgi:signal peptidase I
MTVHQRIKRLFAANKSLLIFFGLMLCFRSAVADWMYVPSGSMNPTIVEGDRILVDKEAYGLRIPFTTKRLTQGSDPQRGDIVIFASPEDGMTLVKRVIGLPGDTVEMRNEQLLINDSAVAYTPLLELAADSDLPGATRGQQHDYLTENLADRAHAIMVLPKRRADRSFGPVRVPAGQYLVLGDSRDNSKDSRYIGFVPRASIVGRALAVAYSLDADRWYRPRGDRLFKSLR